MTDQSTLDDYERVETDGGISGTPLCEECGDPRPAANERKCDDCKPDTWDPDAETVTDAWEGVFLHSSWGYNQTNVEFAQIVDVSDSGKTVLARMVRGEVAERSQGSDGMLPSAEQYGDEFRLQVRADYRGEEPCFRGSYPYIDGDMDNGTRLDNLYVMSDNPDATVHQTAHGYKH